MKPVSGAKNVVDRWSKGPEKGGAGASPFSSRAGRLPLQLQGRARPIHHVGACEALPPALWLQAVLPQQMWGKQFSLINC